MDNVTFLELHDLLEKLIPLYELTDTGSSYQTSLNALKSFALGVDAIGHTNIQEDASRKSSIIRHITICLNETLVQGCNQHAQALCILADVSRQVKWREVFGDCKLQSSHAGWPPTYQEPLAISGPEKWSSRESQCVLQISVRSLHERFNSRDALAAYHAMRLISNCCANDETNKRVVLECGAVELLLRCIEAEIWPDVVIVALWNICADCDDDCRSTSIVSPDGTSRSDIAVAEEMSKVATTQLCLRSAGEYDDCAMSDIVRTTTYSRPAETNIVSSLLQLASIVSDTSRKEMAVELLEKVSWYTFSTTGGANSPTVPAGTRMTRPVVRSRDYLSPLLSGTGRKLAMSVPSCSHDILRSVVVLTSRSEVQQALIDEDLIEAFFKVPTWISTVAGKDDAAIIPPIADKVRQSILQNIYQLSASNGFVAKYGSGAMLSSLTPLSLDAIETAASLPSGVADVDKISPIPACIILANSIRQKEDALFLVHNKGIHLPLTMLLLEQADQSIIFPAMALLCRLAITPANKPALFATGIIQSMARFFNHFDLHPAVQREALSALQSIVEGSLDRMFAIGARPVQEDLGGDQGTSFPFSENSSSMLAALRLFQRTSDLEVKTQVGRLVVEICRTLFQSRNDHPTKVDNACGKLFDEKPFLVECLVFLVCEAPTKGSQMQGWFALAVLSTWNWGQSVVLQSLENDAMRNRIESALDEDDHAVKQNIGRMLTAVDHLQGQNINEYIRSFVQQCISRLSSTVSTPEMITSNANIA